MTINMKYPIAILLFYVPGMMMLIGALMLGFNIDEARGPVALLGVPSGSVVVVTWLISTEFDRIEWRVWGDKR